MQTKNCGYCESEFKTFNDLKLYCDKECADRNTLSKRRYGGNHYRVLKRDNFKCTVCGHDERLHVHHIDEVVEHTDMSNLVTLCQHCHIQLHSSGECNNRYKDITKQQIERAIGATSTLDEAANLLGLTRSALRNKRIQFGMEQLSTSRKGTENKHYIHLKLSEIEMAYQLEGTWVKAAERLGISESFCRKRYKELKGLDKVVNRIYKNVTKEDIVASYEKHGSWKDVMQDLDISKTTLRYHRQKHGLI